MREKQRPIFRKRFKSDRIFDYKLSEEQKELAEVIFHWVKLGALFATIVGCISLYHYTNKYRIPFLGSPASLSITFSVVGMISIYVGGTLFALLFAPLMAQNGTFGKAYPELYTDSDGIPLPKWIQIRRFASIFYTPLLIYVSAIYILGPDLGLPEFLGVFGAWILFVCLVHGQLSNYVSLGLAIGALLFLEISAYSAVVMLLVGVLDMSKDWTSWLVFLLVIGVFAAIQLTVALRWFARKKRNGKIDEDAERKLREDSLRRQAVVCVGFILYLTFMPPSGAFIARVALRTVNSGGEDPVSYCFDAGKYPDPLNEDRVENTSCTAPLKTLLRAGDVVYVLPRSGKPVAVGFTRAGILSERTGE